MNIIATTLTISQVSKKFAQISGNERVLFAKSSCTCLPGTLTVLTGPSGAGKSTLLSCILGYEPFDEGMVQPTDQLIGYLAQQVSLLTDCTVIENICFPSDLKGTTVDAGVADAICVQLQLAPIKQQRAALLSGGEQQRVALARVVVQQPAILIVDEPTSNLDTVTADIVRQFIVTYARAGAVVLAATHDQILMQYADQVLHLEHGVLTSQPMTNFKR